LRQHYKRFTKLEFFNKIFSTHKSTVPASVLSSLPEHFFGAAGVEWSRVNDQWEALFFHDNITKLARFDIAGKLIEYRVNIPPDSILSPIKEAAGDWEIMNCIAVYSSGSLIYELIVRDRELVRYNLCLDSLGNQQRLEKL